MHKVHTLNVDIRNRLAAGEVLVGETSNKNLNDFVAKVVELAPESVYEVGFELGQRLANFHAAGLKNIGGCEFDLLFGTYGQNHFKLYDIKDLYVEFFNSMEEVEPKRDWDLMVFYQHRPSKDVVDKLAKKCKRMLFWMSIGHWEVYTPVGYNIPAEEDIITESLTLQEAKIWTEDLMKDCIIDGPSVEEQLKEFKNGETENGQ